MRAAVCLSLLLAACDPGSVTLVVDVRTDLVPGVEVQRIEVTIPDEGESQSEVVGLDTPLRDAHRVGEWSALSSSADRRIEVVAIALDGSVAARRTARLDNRNSLIVQVVLTRSCGGRTCADAQTCLGGQCVSEACLTGEEPECPDALCEDCDALSACDDAACERGVCLHEAEPDVCGAGLVCAPADGCVTAPGRDAGVADAGVPDAGTRDAGRIDAGRIDAGDAGPTDSGAPLDAGADAGPAICVPPGGTCDLVRQDCGASQTCVPRLRGGEIVAECFEAGSGMAACSSTADCAPGWDCLSDVCRQVCCPGEGFSRCAAAGTVCSMNRGGLSGHCLESECDLPTQMGCEAAEGCYEVAEAVYSCLSAGSGAVGDPCTGENDCIAGLGCGTDMRCTEYCDDSLLPCPAGKDCIDLGGRAFGLCQSAGCDPIANTGCLGQTCYANGPDTAACYPTGSDPLGTSCSVLSQCVPTLTCVGSCRPLCRIGGVPCGSGSCTMISGWAPWGACI